MTVSEASSLRDEMVECFNNYDGLVLDMNDVSECDVSGIQLLYSARLTAHSMGKCFEVGGASERSADILVRAGLDPEMIFATM